MALSPEQLEAVLAHELAHIRRADYVWNLAQTAIETLFFFHPAVWWLGHRVRHHRELCCDDLAVQACGDAVLYATALLRLEEQRSRQLNLAMALDGHRSVSGLRSRIARILGESIGGESIGQKGTHEFAPLPLAVIFSALMLLLTVSATASRRAAPGRDHPSCGTRPASAYSCVAGFQTSCIAAHTQDCCCTAGCGPRSDHAAGNTTIRGRRFVGTQG